MKIPSGPISDDNWPNEGRHTADMTIYEEGNKFIMTITPIRVNSGFNEISCVGL
jgi:hypothetical protein